MTRSSFDRLVANVRNHPHDPALFFRDDHDWRWRSWPWLLEAVLRTVGQLKDNPHTIAYPVHPLPLGLILDLALQSLGCRFLPWPQRDGEKWLVHGNVQAWLKHVGTPVPSAAQKLETLEIDLKNTLLPNANPDLESTILLARGRELKEASTRSFSDIRQFPALLRQERPILLTEDLLRSPLGREFFCWGLGANAAFVLEDDRQALARALWETRPTHVLLRRETLLEVTEALKPQVENRRGWKNLKHRFDRLETIFTDRGSPAPIVEKFWHEVGIPLQGLDEN